MEEKRKGVLVVGAGMAGLIAGIEAAGGGAKVTIVDKLGPMVGRTIKKLYSPGGVANDTTRAGGGGLAQFSYSSPIETMVKAHMERGWGKIDAELIRTYLERVVEYNTWLRDELGMTYRGRLVRGLGPGICPFLYNVAEKRGARLCFSTQVLKLLSEDGRVIGVRAKNVDGEFDLMAQAVILATGGFQGNREMMLRYVGRHLTEDIPLIGSPTNTGDGHLLAAELGGQMVNLSACHVRVTDRFFHIGPARSLRNLYHLGIFLNAQGQRFVDEGLADSDTIANAIALQPGTKAALIFDDKARVKYPEEYEKYPKKKKVIFKVDTLEELASEIEIPVNLLQTTVRNFNIKVQQGEALGLPIPKTTQAFTIDTAPYYGFYPVLPGLNHTLGGLKINARAQVLDQNGSAIPGLYAAGAITNWAYGEAFEVSGVKTWKGSYHAGMSQGLAIALVFGRIAGQEAGAVIHN